MSKYGHMAGEDTGRGRFIGTASGYPYWPFDPQPEDIRIEDIATHLSRECRFGGALAHEIPGIYSVAQHSVLVSQFVPPEHAFEGLLHDAHEAYVRDMVTPFKLGLPQYQAVERLNELVLRRKFGLPKNMTPAVKAVDRRMFATERRDLCPKPHSSLDWGELPDPYDFEITPWLPGIARQRFMARYEELTRHAT